jgi:hypothetical protein
LEDWALSGLIAGIIAGIISMGVISTGLIGNPFAFDFWNIPTIAIIEISFTIIWGIILGAIYSRAHHVISDKIINKGLLYGLFCALVFHIRDYSFGAAYGYLNLFPFTILTIYALIVRITFGLILAVLYGRWYTDEKQQIVTYDMKSGIHPGAIAGFIGGVLAYFCAVFYPYIGLYPPEYPGYLTDNNFMMIQFGSHVFIHLFWGVIFGAIFAKAYNIVPKKGIVKGFYYGLFIFFISTVQIATYDWAYGLTFNSILYTTWGIQYIIFDIVVYPVYGVILGYLYKKK